MHTGRESEVGKYSILQPPAAGKSPFGLRPHTVARTADKTDVDGLGHSAMLVAYLDACTRLSIIPSLKVCQLSANARMPQCLTERLLTAVADQVDCRSRSALALDQLSCPFAFMCALHCITGIQRADERRDQRAAFPARRDRNPGRHHATCNSAAENMQHATAQHHAR